MVYTDNCSGIVELDQSDTTYTSGWDFSFPIRNAVGQKFKPMSRCLKKVTVKLSKDYDNDVYLEIRRSSTTGDKLPDGDPQTSSGRRGYAVIPYSSIPQTPSSADIDITLDAILEPEDLINGVWLILCLSAYDPYCTASDCYINSARAMGGNSTNTEFRYTTIKYGTNAWYSTLGNIYFKTFKQSYGACAIPVCGFSVS